MRKLDYGRLITESESELQQLARKQNQARFRDYLRFLGHLKTGTATTQAAAGALVVLSARQSQNLWRSYRQHGLGHLLSERRGGSVGQLSYVQISQMQAFIRQSSTPLTQLQIGEWIESNFGKRFTQAGVSVLFKRLKIKLKTGRPSNVRKDEAAAEDFKKTSLKP